MTEGKSIPASPGGGQESPQDAAPSSPPPLGDGSGSGSASRLKSPPHPPPGGVVSKQSKKLYGTAGKRHPSPRSRDCKGICVLTVVFAFYSFIFMSHRSMMNSQQKYLYYIAGIVDQVGDQSLLPQNSSVSSLSSGDFEEGEPKSSATKSERLRATEANSMLGTSVGVAETGPNVTHPNGSSGEYRESLLSENKRLKSMLWVPPRPASAVPAAVPPPAAETAVVPTAANHDGISVPVPSLSHVEDGSKFAYAFVIGGCNPQNPAYRNYIYDIMISAHILRENGSKADIVVLFQMSYKSKHHFLPKRDTRLLNLMNVTFHYIPKASTESFYRIMLDKFRILKMTEYSRILFMDGDVIPRGNLDYMFQLSMNGTLKKNVVIGGKVAPANGGFFLLAPEPGDWERVMELIQDKEERGKLLPYPHWDEVKGWGHAIVEPDCYEIGRGKRGHLWNFHGAFTDQGLLYHWVKYEKKSVSIVMKQRVVHYDQSPMNGTVYLEKTTNLSSTFNGVSPERRPCWVTQRTCKPPHSDYAHFTGSSKPWLGGPPPKMTDWLRGTSNITNVMFFEETGSQYWFHILGILDRKYNISIDFDNWRRGHRPLLGMYPKYVDTVNVTYAEES